MKRTRTAPPFTGVTSAGWVSWAFRPGNTIVVACESHDEWARAGFAVVSAASRADAQRLLKAAGVHGLRLAREKHAGEPPEWLCELAEKEPGKVVAVRTPWRDDPQCMPPP